MRTFRRGAAALLAVMLCSAVPGAQQPDEGQRSSGQPRNEALPPEPPPPATFGPSEPRDPIESRNPTERNPTEQERLDNLVAQADDEFVPIDQLPPEEQLPAAPMLVAAYIFVVLALFAYLLSVSRRLATVKQEIARLEAETRRTSGP